MQVIRTEVAEATSNTGEPIIRVLFCGGGGDCITVDMARVQPQTDEVAIDRAKAILVETATVGLAANAYDAESNGNFDEIAVFGADDGNAGVYIFEYRDGEGSRQVPPSRLPSFAMARAEAVRCAIDLLADLQPGRDDLTGWLVRVRAENGDLLCAIDAQEADAARKAAEGSATIDLRRG